MKLSDLLKPYDGKTISTDSWLHIEEKLKKCTDLSHYEITLSGYNFYARKKGNKTLAYAFVISGKSEQIDHPNHYGGAGNPYEAIKVIKAWHLPFTLGNTVKYISRAGKKEKDGNDNRIEDLKKALWYLQYEINDLEKQQSEKK